MNEWIFIDCKRGMQNSFPHSLNEDTAGELRSTTIKHEKHIKQEKSKSCNWTKHKQEKKGKD